MSVLPPLFPRRGSVAEFEGASTGAPSSAASSGASSAASTASRASPTSGASSSRGRSRSESVNLPEPEQFNVGVKVSSPKSLKKTISRMFKPVQTWDEDSAKALSDFDALILESSTKEGEKLLAEGVVLRDESYKDRPTFLEAVENKDRFIGQLIKSSHIDMIVDANGRRIYSDAALNIIKRYLEPIIRICLDRRNPEYLLLMAQSPCASQMLGSDDIIARLHRFDDALEEAIREKNIDSFTSALFLGLGVSVQVALILCSGVDIANYESMVWTSATLKDILENQEIPIGVKPAELFQKRYSMCVDYFGNPAIINALRNSTSTVYNRTRRINAAFNGSVPGATTSGNKALLPPSGAGKSRKRRLNRRKTRRSRR